MLLLVHLSSSWIVQKFEVLAKPTAEQLPEYQGRYIQLDEVWLKEATDPVPLVSKKRRWSSYFIGA